ncbi:MAG: DUF4307 domain-containing protein [Frankiaceae bacterium]
MTRPPSIRRAPAGRYGNRRPPRAFYLVGGALLLGLIVVIVYLGHQAGTPDVTYGVRAFSTGDRSVRITFEVRLPPERTAVCVLRARDRRGVEVGRREVTVPAPEGDRAVVLTATLTTSARPVTGEVNGCRLTG